MDLYDDFGSIESSGTDTSESETIGIEASESTSGEQIESTVSCNVETIRDDETTDGRFAEETDKKYDMDEFVNQSAPELNSLETDDETTDGEFAEETDKKYDMDEFVNQSAPELNSLEADDETTDGEFAEETDKKYDMDEFVNQSAPELNSLEADDEITDGEFAEETDDKYNADEFIVCNARNQNELEVGDDSILRDGERTENVESLQHDAGTLEEFQSDEYIEHKVLKRSEYDLLMTGNRNNDMILEELKKDYQDKGLSEEEISRNLDRDEERLQREFLDDAFPGQYIPTEVFESIEDGTFSRDEWFGKRDNEETDIQGEDTAFINESTEGGEYREYENFYSSVRSMELSEEYEKIIFDRFNEMDPDMKAEYNEYADRLVCLDSNYCIVDRNGNVRDSAYFDSSEGGFRFNQELDEKNLLGAGNTFFHESAHMIDWLKGTESGGENASIVNEMTHAVLQDYEGAVKRIQEKSGCSVKEAEKIINDDLMNNPIESNTVSDVFGGITYNRVSGWYTHDNDYWRSKPMNVVGKEAFAEITADRICNRQNLEFTRKYLPRTMEAYDRALKMRGEKQ